MKKLLTNIGQLATFIGNSAKKGRQMSEVRLIDDCAVLIEDQRICAVLSKAEAQAVFADCELIDCRQGLVTSGYVDCHTHLVFDGDRAEEFNLRLQGVPYMEIMNKGGGIAKTVAATRQANKRQLYQSTVNKLQRALEYGVTTLEAKSGYGLDLDTELMQIETAAEASSNHPVDVICTYMGAHATPKELCKDEYVDFIVNTALPEVRKQGIAQFCDCFCEPNVFDVNDCKRIMLKAVQLGLGLKIHADEVKNIGGSSLAAELNAISCEHLLHISQKDVDKLASSQTVAVLLPATAFSLQEQYAPARQMIDSGCKVAIASDYNPGSCNTQSIPLLIALSTIYMKMSIAETLCALTINGAAAIGKAEEIGTVEKGKYADLIIHNVKILDQLCYNFATNSIDTVIKKGKIVFNKQ